MTFSQNMMKAGATGLIGAASVPSFAAATKTKAVFDVPGTVVNFYPKDVEGTVKTDKIEVVSPSGVVSTFTHNEDVGDRTHANFANVTLQCGTLTALYEPGATASDDPVLQKFKVEKGAVDAKGDWVGSAATVQNTATTPADAEFSEVHCRGWDEINSVYTLVGSFPADDEMDPVTFSGARVDILPNVITAGDENATSPTASTRMGKFLLGRNTRIVINGTLQSLSVKAAPAPACDHADNGGLSWDNDLFIPLISVSGALLVCLLVVLMLAYPGLLTDIVSAPFDAMCPPRAQQPPPSSGIQLPMFASGQRVQYGGKNRGRGRRSVPAGGRW